MLRSIVKPCWVSVESVLKVCGVTESARQLHALSSQHCSQHCSQQLKIIQFGDNKDVLEFYAAPN